MNKFIPLIIKIITTNFGYPISKLIFFTRFSSINFFFNKKILPIKDVLSDIDNKFCQSELEKVQNIINSLSNNASILELGPSNGALTVFIAQIIKLTKKKLYVSFSNENVFNQFSIYDWHRIIIRKNIIPYITLIYKNNLNYEQLKSLEFIILYKSGNIYHTEILFEIKKYVDINKIKIIEVDDLTQNSFMSSPFLLNNLLNEQ